MNKSFLILTIALFSFSAYAEGQNLAGCGLGSRIMKKNTVPNQVMAATSNSISGNQTFAISSGTSNCKAGSAGSAAIFIEGNKVALANDLARGQGEAFDTLMAIYGCNNPVATSKTLKRNYARIFTSSNVKAQQVDRNITSVLKADHNGDCSRISL
jgi:hypothetical protein